MAVDLNIDPIVRSSGEWSVAAPANTSSYLITVPYNPAEWLVPQRLLIEAFDGAGHFLGSSDNTQVAIDKVTRLPRDFYLDIVMGIELESNFPTDRKRGRVVLIDGVRYRQVLIDSPFVARITVNSPITYGLSITLSSR